MLPGVDDGARDLDESIDMASVAAADAPRAMVVTPHVRPDFVTDVWPPRDAFRELRLASGGMGIAVELRCGGELGHDLVSRLEQARSRQTRSARPAAGCSSRRPFDGIEEEFTAATDELRERGFGI
jgi:tyrosine-protein phosphatase YwqE